MYSNDGCRVNVCNLPIADGLIPDLCRGAYETEARKAVLNRLPAVLREIEFPCWEWKEHDKAFACVSQVTSLQISLHILLTASRLTAQLHVHIMLLTMHGLMHTGMVGQRSCGGGHEVQPAAHTEHCNGQGVLGSSSG